MLKLGKEVLASQPFSKLVGAELTAFAPGHVELTVKISDQLKQQHGFLHGGVISYAADNALTFNLSCFSLADVSFRRRNKGDESVANHSK